MRIDHLYGRSVADTAAMAALTGYPPAAIRRYCKREEHGYDVNASEQILWALPRPVLVTAAEGARRLDIPVGTIYAWASQSRARLKSWQRDPRGRPLYDMEDLHRLAHVDDQAEDSTA